MNPLTAADLLPTAPQPTPPAEWVRVQLATGGIAAGAATTLEELRAAAQEIQPGLPVLRVGSHGRSFADPVIEIRSRGMPDTLYGRVEPGLARELLTAHVRDHRLLDDHVLATSNQGQAITAPVTHVLVLDTGTGEAKTAFFQFSLVQELKRRGLADGVQIVRALDIGVHDEGVVVQLLPSGVTYTNVLAPDVARIVEESIIHRRTLDDLLWKHPDPQVRIVLRNCGVIDPEEISDYLAQAQGYQALRRALVEMTPGQVIAEMKTSGLRGRGGAGFPTWKKWELTRAQPAEPRYIICNADEGDPGAFMDRSVLESDPHTVLEGMMLAAYAIGASMGYFYIRAEYPKAVARVERALVQAREAGLLGKNILGSGFSFEAKIRLGAGAFVCGEETALIASIEGKRGSPSPRPPYPSVRGLWGRPTSINNVETLANVPAILLRGGAWYASHGVEGSRGTKVFAVTGKVRHAQLVEVPMGTTLRQVVFDVCGGVQDDREIKAVQTGGPSGGVIPDAQLDTPVAYETLQQLGSIMGSGGMIVMDATDSIVEVAKFYLKFCVDESCGKCAPCRIGGYQMSQILDRISRGRGTAEDIPTLRRICLAMQRASLCGLGQTAPNPVLSSLRYFREEYQAYIEGGPSYARKMSRPGGSEPPPRPLIVTPTAATTVATP